MTTNPIPHPDGWKIRWRVKIDGAWKWQQGPIEREHSDALRLADYIDSLPTVKICDVPLIMGKILATDPRIVGRAYLFGEKEARRRAAGHDVFTFGQAVDEYAARNQARWSGKTGPAVVARIEKHFADWLDKPVADLNAADLNAAYARLRATDMSYNYVLATISRAKGVLRLAFANGRTSYNPRSEADKDALDFDIKPTTEFHREAISPETFRDLWRLAPDAQTSAMLLTAVSIGTRIGELCALRVCDVKLTGARPTIKIAGNMAGNRWQGWTKAEKGRAKVAPRPMPISDELAAALAPLVAGRPDNAPLFAYHDARKPLGSPDRHWHPDVWRERVWNPLVTAARAAGVELPAGFVPHSLRHSMATWMAVRVPTPILQARMRHATIAMSLRYYTHSEEAEILEHRAITDALALAA